MSKILKMALAPDIFNFVVPPFLSDYDFFQQRLVNRDAYQRWLRRKTAYLSTRQAFDDAIIHDDLERLIEIANTKSIEHVMSMMDTRFAELTNWYQPGKVLDFLVTSQPYNDDQHDPLGTRPGGERDGAVRETPEIQIQFLLTEDPEYAGRELTFAAGKIDEALRQGRRTNGEAFVEWVRYLLEIEDSALEILLGLIDQGQPNAQGGLRAMLRIFERWELPLTEDDREMLVWNMMEANRRVKEELNDPEAVVYTAADFQAIELYPIS